MSQRGTTTSRLSLPERVWRMLCRILCMGLRGSISAVFEASGEGIVVAYGQYGVGVVQCGDRTPLVSHGEDLGRR